MILLAAVAFIVIWLRFQLRERIGNAMVDLVLFTLQAHGTRKLVNGRDTRVQHNQGKPNRAQRRAERHYQ